MNALNPARAELLETFALDTAIVRGSGCHLYDDAGRSYLDFLAQYGALPFGHNPPEIWEALIAAQRAGTPAMLQPLRALEAERLARRLAEITPGDLEIVTLANSGAETVEAALKLARVRTGRDGILSTWNGFHGKTLGALSATGKSCYQQDFAAPAPGFGYVPFGDLDALRARLEAGAGGIAAFIVEPIQGEGGVICPPEGYIDGAIALCREFGVLTILDEIQSGLGRTGALFACSGGAETPDMLLLAKALGGGVMPIGACIVRPSAWDDRFGRLHSSTFANNNLAAAAACAAIDRLLADDGRLIAEVARNGSHLRGRLEALQARYPAVIREVRGRGYMAGLDFHRFDDRDESATMAFAGLNGGALGLISSYLMNVEGLLTAPLFNEAHVLRLQPPLVAGQQEIDRAVDALENVCGVIERRDYCTLVRHLAVPRATGGTSRAAQAARPKSRAARPPQPGRFAFLIHYTEEEDIFRSDPSFRDFSRLELDNWLGWVKRLGPGFARRIPRVTSKTGETAEGWLLSVPMLPSDMRGRGRAGATSMICEAVDLAADAGAARLGLGAFTSIVTRGGDMARGRGVPITSGNTLTTVAAVQGLEQVARRVGLRIEDANVAVIGASGAIGRLAALMLARRAERLTLVGNSANPFAEALLSKVAGEVEASVASQPVRLSDALERPRGAGALQLSWTTDLGRALADADIVLVATSSDTTLVDPRALRPGTLVCDVARPPNVAKADLSRSGVLVFDGGLVRPPSEVDLGPFQTLPPRLCWGCLGETMLLALAREERDFSIGSRLSLEDADRIADLAARHGFAPAAPQWYGTDLGEADFARLARHAGRTGRRSADALGKLAIPRVATG